MRLNYWFFLTRDEKIEAIKTASDTYWKQLVDNLHIVDAFVSELQTEHTYYTNSSARYIVEKLRRRSALRDNSVVFKISNDFIPKLNHFAIDCFPQEMEGFLKRKSSI